MIRRVSLFILAAALSGCAVVSEKELFTEVAATARARSGVELSMIESREDEQAVVERIRGLLAGELGVEQAIQVAILNNRGLQSTYQELGLGRANLLEAVSAFSPTASVSARFPEGGGGTNLEFGIVQNFVSLLFLPSKRRLAESALLSAKARVGNEVTLLIQLAENAYYDAVEARQKFELLKHIYQAADANFSLIEAQYEAGNTSALTRLSERAFAEEAKLAVAESEREVRRSREALNVVMGVWTDTDSWRVPDQLSDSFVEVPDLAKVENIALSNRLDLAAAKADLDSANIALGSAIPLGVLQTTEIGIDSEREPSGQWVTGPNLSFPIPFLFSTQAVRDRSTAQYKAAYFRLYDLSVKVRAEARKARDDLITASERLKFIKETLIPLRQAVVKESQLHFNGMFIGTSTLLEAKRSQIIAGVSYVETLADVWRARAELARVLGIRTSAKGKVASEVRVEPEHVPHSHHHVKQ